MAYIKEYWEDKEKRAEQAKEHTKEMERRYQKEIAHSYQETRLYDEHNTWNKCRKEKQTVISVVPLDTVTAGNKCVAENAFGKTALLNFSSYKNAGGMFLNGSKAQEECLCHASFLYNVLTRWEDAFYAQNRTCLNRALYQNRALYVPDIVFHQDGNVFSCDVITCAAPNKSAAQKYCRVSDAENTEVLKSRIKYVLDIAEDNDVDTLILGAYGCGVFGQNPAEVAAVFQGCLETTHKNCFANIVFAILEGKNKNLEIFQSVFGTEYVQNLTCLEDELEREI